MKVHRPNAGGRLGVTDRQCAARQVDVGPLEIHRRREQGGPRVRADRQRARPSGSRARQGVAAASDDTTRQTLAAGPRRPDARREASPGPAYAVSAWPVPTRQTHRRGCRSASAPHRLVGLQAKSIGELAATSWNAVSLRRSDVSQALVQTLGSAHRTARPQHDGRIAPMPRTFPALVHQGTGDARPTCGPLYCQPQELRLLRAGDRSERDAVGDKGNGADHPLFALGHEHITRHSGFAHIGFAPRRSSYAELANEHVTPQTGNV